METESKINITINADTVKGHRKRVKDKFFKTNFEGWHDYEILEFALFFAISRKDTKQIAKDLIKKFGSLKDVLFADYDELKEFFKDVKGVGEHVAYFLYFLKNFAVKYSEFAVKEKEKISGPQETVDFLKNFIGTSNEEKMTALFLNASNKVLDCKIISEGTVSRSAVYPSKIVKNAVLTDARSVIVAHNHPGGVCKPSQNDIIATEAIQKALKTVDVMLLDHIIVTNADYYSFKDNGLI